MAKKKVDLRTLTAAQAADLAAWLEDRAGEMKADRRSIKAECGYDQVGAIEALAEQVREGHK